MNLFEPKRGFYPIRIEAPFFESLRLRQSFGIGNGVFTHKGLPMIAYATELRLFDAIELRLFYASSASVCAV